MKQIIFLLLISFFIKGCANSDPGTTVVDIPLKVENISKEQLEETVKDKTVTVEKVGKKKFIRKKVIEAQYTEYIFK